MRNIPAPPRRLEVRFYPARLEVPADRPELTPSRAVRYAEDARRTAAAARTDHSRPYRARIDRPLPPPPPRPWWRRLLDRLHA